MAMYLSYTPDPIYMDHTEEEYQAALQEGYDNGYTVGVNDGTFNGVTGTVWDWNEATDLQKQAMQAAIDDGVLDPDDVPNYPTTE